MNLYPSNPLKPRTTDDYRTGDGNPACRVESSTTIRRRNLHTTRTRSGSVDSLDKLFDTQGPDASYVANASAPLLTSIEKSFIEETHGVNEARDGFFEAVFLTAGSDSDTPLSREERGFSFLKLLLSQPHDAWLVIHRVTTTRSGVRLLKSFLGFFIAYILCLIPAVRDRFGRYAYIMVISAIMNHPGRSVGAQVDGTLLTILGTATGLGWGAFGLWLSTVTETARSGFGPILAVFLFTFIFVIACLRSYYIRTYQLVICAGIAISYTCLAEIAEDQVTWPKQLAYGYAWLIGQAVSLVVCVIITPDGGSRSFAAGMHKIFDTMVDAIPPVQEFGRMRISLAHAFVTMSHIYRDLVIDFSVTTLDPKDALMLRNSVQAVIRALLSLRDESSLPRPLTSSSLDPDGIPPGELQEFIVDLSARSQHSDENQERESVEFVAESLAAPMKNLLHSMSQSLKCCDAVLMEICGHRRSLGPPKEVSNDVHGALAHLREHIATFIDTQEKILCSDRLPLTYSKLPDIVQVFAFCRPVHQAASSIESLATQLSNLQQRRLRYPHLHRPSYPFIKALHRTNAQVRHDRGGVTAGSYFRNLSDIARIIKKIESRELHRVSRNELPMNGDDDALSVTTAAESPENGSQSRKPYLFDRLRALFTQVSREGVPVQKDDDIADNPIGEHKTSKEARFFHGIWTILHRLQGFETRFGLKTALVTSLLALPAYLPDSQDWWNDHQAWWAVVMSWLIMGPRTGGNIQDLFTRVFYAALGSLWAGLSYAAGNGNPYVIAAFAVIFMLPMMYRFTQSDHPRSGLVGCISFTFISLSALEKDGFSATGVAARGASIVIGVAASVIVNWVLWPFVARHDLRKGIASMIFNCSILYRSTMAQYVYYDEGDAPTNEDIRASEILEGRLREGFVRLRELLGLTHHEIRLRAPFDPLPYSALISACERFFEHIVTVRQTSSFYRPHFIGDNSEAAVRLLGYRRDAIASVMMNLYVLSGALRANRPIPKFLPNAAIARIRLLDRMFELEREHGRSENYSSEQKRKEMRLGQVYRYSYNESLTGCVEQVQQLEKYTKLIVGQK